MAASRLLLSAGRKLKPSKSYGDLPSTFAKSLTCGYSTKLPSDKVTHTGQKWEEDDYRMVRFVGKSKLVSNNWAAKLIDEVPPKPKKSRVVWCDGGGGPTGHPKVYINLDKPGNHSCGYCGLRFVKEDGHH